MMGRCPRRGDAHGGDMPVGRCVWFPQWGHAGGAHGGELPHDGVKLTAPTMGR